MLLIRVFDRGVEEEDRDSNTATTFIRQKEGWISDEISQWTYYIDTYAVMPFQKIEVTAHYLSVRVKKECCVGIISTIILKGFFEVHYSSPPHHRILDSVFAHNSKRSLNLDDVGRAIFYTQMNLSNHCVKVLFRVSKCHLVFGSEIRPDYLNWQRRSRT